MVTDELLNFIRTELSRGVSREAIMRVLIEKSKAGWKKADVEEAFKTLEEAKGAQKVQSAAAHSAPQLSSPEHTDEYKEFLSKEQTNPSKKYMLGALAVLFGIFFVGGGVFAFWFLERQNKADDILIRAYENMLSLEAATFTGEVSANIQARTAGFSILGEAATPGASRNLNTKHTAAFLGGFSNLFGNLIGAPGSITDYGLAASPTDFSLSLLVDFYGGFDILDKEDSRLDFDSSISFKINDGGAMNINYNPSLKIKMIKDAIYFFVSGISFLGEEASAYDSKWIKLDFEDLSETLGEIDPYSVDYIEDQLQMYKGGLANQQLSPESKEKLVRLLDETDFIYVKKVLRGEKINGAPTYHYSIGIKWGEVGTILPQLLEIVYEESDYAEKFIPSFREMIRLFAGSEEEFNKKLEEVGEVLDKILRIEWWIDKESVIPRRVKYALDFDEKILEDLVGDGAFGGVEAAVSMRFFINYDNFNKPYGVSEPQTSTLISEILGLSLLDTRSRARDAQRVSDLKQLQLANEFYYDDNNFQYAQSFNELSPTYLPALPKDPSSGFPYSYAVSPDGSNYHIGASLEDSESSRYRLNTDADFSSLSRGWQAGFSGSDSASCSPSDFGFACYDLTGI